MGFKTILVPIERHDLMRSTLETAVLLVRKFDSYIEGFALRGETSAVFAVGDIGAVPIPALEREIAEHEKWSEAYSRALCKSMVCRAELTQVAYRAIGWKIRLRAPPPLWAAMVVSSTSLS